MVGRTFDEELGIRLQASIDKPLEYTRELVVAIQDIQKNMPSGKIDVVPPSVNDDLTMGYEVGSHWYDVVAKKSYECFVATAGAAEWKQTTGVTVEVDPNALWNDGSVPVGGDFDWNNYDLLNVKDFSATGVEVGSGGVSRSGTNPILFNVNGAEVARFEGSNGAFKIADGHNQLFQQSTDGGNTNALNFSGAGKIYAKSGKQYFHHSGNDIAWFDQFNWYMDRNFQLQSGRHITLVADGTSDLADATNRFGNAHLAGYVSLGEMSAPTQAADRALLYSKDDGGVTKLYQKWSDGTEKELGASSGMAGPGTSTVNAVPVWDVGDGTSVADSKFLVGSLTNQLQLTEPAPKEWALSPVVAGGNVWTILRLRGNPYDGTHFQLFRADPGGAGGNADWGYNPNSGGFFVLGSNSGSTPLYISLQGTVSNAPTIGMKFNWGGPIDVLNSPFIIKGTSSLEFDGGTQDIKMYRPTASVLEITSQEGGGHPNPIITKLTNPFATTAGELQIMKDASTYLQFHPDEVFHNIGHRIKAYGGRSLRIEHDDAQAIEFHINNAEVGRWNIAGNFQPINKIEFNPADPAYVYESGSGNLFLESKPGKTVIVKDTGSNTGTLKIGYEGAYIQGLAGEDDLRFHADNSIYEFDGATNDLRVILNNADQTQFYRENVTAPVWVWNPHQTGATANYHQFLFNNANSIQFEFGYVGNDEWVELDFHGTGRDGFRIRNDGTTAVEVDPSTNVTAGKGSLVAADTDGFLYIPEIAAAPTSSPPTAKTGFVPICFLKSTKTLYIHDGSNWTSVALT